jgi:hypothetical protein
MYKQLTERLNEALRREGVIVKFWERGEIKRLYISERCLYHTRKCTQTAYINLNNFHLNVYTDCPQQSEKWCSNESASYFRHALRYARLASLIWFNLNKANQNGAAA